MPEDCTNNTSKEHVNGGKQVNQETKETQATQEKQSNPDDREQRDKREKRNKLIIILLILLLIITLGVTVWALFFRDGDSTLAPDYAPQSVEDNAEPIGDESGEKLEKPAGGGSVSLLYSKSVVIDLSDKTARLMFGNPSRSNSDMLIQLVIQDKVIVQSGRIIPGNKVTSLPLSEGADKLLSPGGYNGMFIVFYYDPTTGEKAMINTEIPVNVTVHK